MPIDFQSYEPDENEGGGVRITEGSNAYELLQFLAEHPHQGFTPKEIAMETGIPPR